MKNIEKYYNELYSEKITLQSLARNILVDSYQSVNFKKSNNLVICETICDLSEKNTVTYKYSFDDEMLLLLEKISDDESIILYDREQEIKKLSSKLIAAKQDLA
jgi:hypothetical protein